MRMKETPVYSFDELSDKAKEKAREWFRESYPWQGWWDGVFVDAKTIAALFGLTIREYDQKYHVMAGHGKPARDGVEHCIAIFFSGFWSQGDGACYEGEYVYKADALEAVKDHAPTDAKLHEIIADLQNAQADAGNRVAFSIRHTDNHYSHERSMTMTLADECLNDEDGNEWPEGQHITIAQEKAVEEMLIRFAKWIYRQLESEYEYLTSDEQVDESIRCNEYEFNENGEIE